MNNTTYPIGTQITITTYCHTMNTSEQRPNYTATIEREYKDGTYKIGDIRARILNNGDVKIWGRNYKLTFYAVTEAIAPRN